ncbi:unnamed protein product [Brachionus calyciflorus]|uniref:Uncharacterized protein n=1 Tax=Brachionus calyciflorus TaxID=104777 RepID=A0A814KKV2_9BILA|nr:unnamed protein product [Brachionus calyciflorus]
MSMVPYNSQSAQTVMTSSPQYSSFNFGSNFPSSFSSNQYSAFPSAYSSFNSQPNYSQNYYPQQATQSSLPTMTASSYPAQNNYLSPDVYSGSDNFSSYPQQSPSEYSNIQAGNNYYSSQQSYSPYSYASPAQQSWNPSSFYGF